MAKRVARTIKNKSHKDLMKEISVLMGHNRKLGQFAMGAIAAMKKAHFNAAGLHDGNFFVRHIRCRKYLRIICEALGPYLVDVEQKVDDGVSTIKEGEKDVKSKSGEGLRPVPDSEPGGERGDEQQDRQGA